ncbi:MAG: diguanylate cyclase [Eubacterium sp.]|nr:diguanylate cyclase [Eubacterium sp.]
MKKNPFKRFAAGLLVVAVGLSMVAYLFFGLDKDTVKEERLLVAQMVDHSVLDTLTQTITIAQMMRRDEELIALLNEESAYSEEVNTKKMRAYLSDIQKQFDYETVYVVSDATKRYYTYSGLNKVIDPENDSFDTWYTTFVEHDVDYELESSEDEANREQLTVFVDGRVEDEEGTLLGVCGVGVKTKAVQKILANYESEYGVRLDYVNEDGLIQMSDELKAINNSYVSGISLSGTEDETYHYQTYGLDGFSIVKYVPDLGWYLVVRSERAYVGNSYNYRFFFAEILILIVTMTILIVVARNTRTESFMIFRNNLNVDSLTGLPNRDYFIRIYGEEGTLNTTRYQSIAEFSIDDFDSIDRISTRERIVLSVVQTARETFGKHGQITRWNRSAFVVLLETSEEESDVLCKKFCKTIEEIGEVTVSVGLTKIELTETLKKNYYRAAQNMYLVKELGGNNVKKG